MAAKGVGRGDTVGIMLDQPPRVPLHRHRRDPPRGDPVLDLQHLDSRADRVRASETPGTGSCSPSRRFLDTVLEARDGVDRRRAHRRRRRRGRATGRSRSTSSKRAAARSSTSKPPGARSSPTTCSDPDLHLGDDRAAEGRPAHPRQPARRVQLGLDDVFRLSPGGRVVSWLPMAHIAERNAQPLRADDLRRSTRTCCPDPRQVVAYLVEVRPTWFFAVPRIWEKLKAAMEIGFDSRAGRGPQREAVESAPRSRPPQKVARRAGRQAPRRDELAARIRESRRRGPLRPARADRPRQARVRSTSAPRRRRARCSSSSSRSGSRWPSSGGCRRPAAIGDAQPARSGSGSGPSGPPVPGSRAEAGRGRRGAGARAAW